MTASWCACIVLWTAVAGRLNFGTKSAKANRLSQQILSTKCRMQLQVPWKRKMECIQQLLSLQCQLAKRLAQSCRVGWDGYYQALCELLEWSPCCGWCRLEKAWRLMKQRSAWTFWAAIPSPTRQPPGCASLWTNASGREYPLHCASFVSLHAALQDSSTCMYVYCALPMTQEQGLKPEKTWITLSGVT